ncbi:MAG: HAMP domain-containing histidine kinase [Ruminococcus sp.]|nr:HAMP domain-containing histidine kinase [Ruminococcus sp.]
MFKKISIKYALSTVAVISLVTIIFIPIYMYVQKSIYINLEISKMEEFLGSIPRLVDLSDSDKIGSFLENNNERNYSVNIYGDNLRLIYSTQHPMQSSDKQNDHKLSKNLLKNYSENAEPIYRDEQYFNGESIVVRKIIKSDNKQYYINIRRGLKSINSIFSYTNGVLIFILIMYMVVCLLVLFLVTGGFTKSIRRLNSVVQKISENDYSVRYEGKISKDEVGTLAQNFNNMADTIQDNINSINNYNFLLKEDIDHLREYEELRKQFVRNTTHELKTPLAIISSQIEMMRCIKDEEKSNYYYNSAQEEIKKMSSLITSFLNYSVEERETFRSKAGEINLSEQIENLCNNCSSWMFTKNIKLLRKIESGCIAHISVTHVEHIFNNFITNAVKHTSKNGKIVVTLSKLENGCRLAVFNEGSQIREENLSKIWTEFYTSSKEKDNVGLGLFIVKEISLMNGMNCGVENKNSGVDFWFDFV